MLRSVLVLSLGFVLVSSSAFGAQGQSVGQQAPPPPPPKKAVVRPPRTNTPGKTGTKPPPKTTYPPRGQHPPRTGGSSGGGDDVPSAPPTKDPGHNHGEGSDGTTTPPPNDTHEPRNPPRRPPRIIIDPFPDPIRVPQNDKPKKPEKPDEPRQLTLDGKKYRQLADTLLGAGDINSALMVIQLLKDYEYWKYTGDKNLIASADVNDFGFAPGDLQRVVAKEKKKSKSSKDEKKSVESGNEASGDSWEGRFEKLTDDLLLLGQEADSLRAVPAANRTPEQQKRLEKVEKDLAKAREELNIVLASVSSDSSSKDVRSASIRRMDQLTANLAQSRPGTVAIYTLTAPERTWVILCTPTTRGSYRTTVPEAELERRVLAFRKTLMDPTSDPLPQAKDLYTLLLSRLDVDLQTKAAHTLLWSFDGVLRYIPVTALHDGQRYMVEKYENALFNRESIAHMLDAPSSTVTGVGLGVAKQVGGFAPLPSVAEELNGIFADGGPGGAEGVVPGAVFLDTSFTENAFEGALRTGYPVVHVATHFHLANSSATDSLLLLGDGTLMTVGQIKALKGAFRGIDLLTLSACDTASSSPGADGREVECFATIAQEKGARAVIASLWPVNDRSTSELMQSFYRMRQQRPNASKSELLANAQKMLLHDTTEGGGSDRALVHRTPANPAVKTSFTHPFYWAPFVLVGNVK